MAEDEKDPPVDDPPEDDEDEYEPPDKDSWERTTASLKKANDEAKKWRLRAQGKDDKWAVPGWKKDAPPEDDPEDDDKPPARRRQPRVNEDQIRREAEEAALAKAKPGLVRAAARDAFKAAGLILPEKGSADAAIARATRLLDMDAVEVDEDGTVSGIDQAVKDVRRDYPELFTPRGPRRVNAGAGSNGDGPGPKEETSANKLAKALGLS